MHIVFAADQAFVRQLLVASGSAVYASDAASVGSAFAVARMSWSDARGRASSASRSTAFLK